MHIMPTYLFNKLTVQIEQGDLTRQTVDAIVNAANSHLQHGGGVALAIVKRGGLIIQEESNDWIRQHGLVTHDRPAITGGGNLACRHVIHAVGPVWGEGDEVSKLMTVVTSCLQVASDLKCKSIAFPAISTGIFGFPAKLAAECFRESIADFSIHYSLPFLQVINLVLFDRTTFETFIDAFTSNGG